MNVVEKVRYKYDNEEYLNEDFNAGYLRALNDVEQELRNEDISHVEKELQKTQGYLECKIKQLNEEHEKALEKIKSYYNGLEKSYELNRAKIEMVELIFGGNNQNKIKYR